jgi:F0F1-type ATP synthase assembly protein I
MIAVLVFGFFIGLCVGFIAGVEMTVRTSADVVKEQLAKHGYKPPPPEKS